MIRSLSECLYIHTAFENCSFFFFELDPAWLINHRMYADDTLVFVYIRSEQ